MQIEIAKTAELKLFSLRGTLRDQFLRPVDRAEMTFVHDMFGPIGTVMTDEKGEYQRDGYFAVTEEGRKVVPCFTPVGNYQIHILKKGWYAATTEVRFDVGEETDLCVAMPIGRLTGRLQDGEMETVLNGVGTMVQIYRCGEVITSALPVAQDGKAFDGIFPFGDYEFQVVRADGRIFRSEVIAHDGSVSYTEESVFKLFPAVS